MSRSRWTRAAALTVAALLPALGLTPGAAQAAPAGNAKAFALLSQSNGKGVVARWNPCAGPIDYRVNLDRAPAGSLAEVKEAVARLSAASGLTFRYAGTTKVIPMATKGYTGTYPSGTELVIAWVNRGKQSTMLPASVPKTTAGMGGASWSTSWTATGADAMTIRQAQVVLNADTTRTMTRGFGASQVGTTGQLIMHELGHATGLAHPAIADRSQIMYPMMTGKKAVWGAGDLTGLGKLGKKQGCLHDTNPKATMTKAGLTAARSGQVVTRD